MNKIRLKFLGAIDTVTGSCTLMEYNGIRGIHYYLIDAGEYQNEGKETMQIRERELEKYAGKIKIIFITHAHLDHIGLLPKLINWGFQGQIYGTKATIELTKIMLEDAMKIAGKNGDEISNAIKKMKFYEFDKNHKEITFNGWGKTFIKLQKDFAVRILRSSHILGSCTWLFSWTEIEYEDKTELKDKEWRSIYFSGDIGPVRGDIVPNILFNEHQIPFQNPQNKITIILESTYGNRNRTKYKYQDKITKLAEIIFECVKKGRFVLIPTFSLDRAQQVVVDLNYIKHKYSIDGKKWADIKNTDLDNLLHNKNKDDVILLMKNNPSKKQKKRIKKKIEDMFNGYSTFQNLPEQKKDELRLFLKTNNCIDINIGIKSPLIRRVNGIYADLLMDDVYSEKEKKPKYKYLSDEFLEKFNFNKESTSSKDDIKKLLKELFNCNETGNVVVAASGMCDEGTVLQLLKKHLKDENTTIILTGYQAENTNGYYLKNYSDGKYKEEDKKYKSENERHGRESGAELFDNEDIFFETENIDIEENIESMTLLEHIDRILKSYSLIHGKHEDQEKKRHLQDKLDSHLAVCSDILEIDTVQALIFSFILNSETASLRSLSNFLHITKVLILNHLDDLDVLKNKRLIRKSERGYIASIDESTDGSELHSCYWVPGEVIQAIRAGKAFSPPRHRDVAKNQFFGLLKNLFWDLVHGNISRNVFIMDFMALFEDNPHLEFVKKITELCLSEESRIVLSYFCMLFLMNETESFSLSESNLAILIGQKELYARMLGRKKSYIEELLEKELVEYDGDEFKDENQVVLTHKTISELLEMTEFKEKRRERKTDSAIINCKAIMKKALFYNEIEGRQIEQLTSLLKEENFKAIVDRLKSKGMKAGFTCLFFGDPGTGKTETAYQIAQITGRDIIPVDISATKSCWFGESEKITKEIFSKYREWVKKAAHRNKPIPILLLNEADAFISRRKDVGVSAVAQTENSIQNIILEELEQFEGILLATTNLIENIDFAFDRRFIYKIEFKKPDTGTRQSIWNSLIPELSEQENFELATNFDFSGGQIENIARKRMITGILTGTEPDISAMLNMCKAESLVKNDVKIGF